MSLTNNQDMALLSLYVYGGEETGQSGNRPNLPAGWEELEPPRTTLDGFSCGVFRRVGTNEIVIAFAGTGTGLDRDWLSNLSIGVGLSSSQVTHAARVYMEVKRSEPLASVSFTGHSLGGGLASIMGVWFDRPAITFDQAPFELTAKNTALIEFTKLNLALAGLSDPAFTAYHGETLEFLARESMIANHYLEGEALAIMRTLWFPIIGIDNKVAVNTNGIGAVDLHSQALLTAAMLSPSFAAATLTADFILPLLGDKRFYATEATTRSQDITMNLIRSEQGARGAGKLTKLAQDLTTLVSGNGLAPTAHKALTAQAMEWYYWCAANAGLRISTHDRFIDPQFTADNCPKAARP